MAEADAKKETGDAGRSSSEDVKPTNLPDDAATSSSDDANTTNLPEKAVDAAPSNDEPEEEQHEYISGFRLAAVMGSITLCGFLMLLDMSILATAIPRITTEFHSLDDVGWYGAAYNLASAALQPLTGKVYTYFKAKWVFISCLFVFALGSLICGVATSSTMLIVGRAVAGMGTSGIQNGAFTIISNSIPLEKRPPLLGVLIGGSQLGIVIGPLLGGAITEYSTWRWCFYLNLPACAVVAAILVFVHIPERTIKVEHGLIKTVLSKLDLSGFALFAPAAIMFLLGLEYGGRTYPWRSATVIGLLVGSVATFVVFFVWEHRQGEIAMFPLKMIRKREVWTSMLAGSLMLGCLTFVPSYYMPIYFQSVKGVSPFTSGVYVLPSILSSVFFGIIAGFAVSKLGYYLPFVLLCGTTGAIGSGLLSTLSPSTTTGQWVGYQILVGVRGVGMQMPMLAIQAVVPQSQNSVAMALLVFAQTFGGAIFLTIAQSIFTDSLVSGLQAYTPTIDIERIVHAGASGFRDIISESDLPGVLLAYSDSIDKVMYLALASSVGIVAVGLGMGWHDIRKKEKPSPGAA
ncbi:putative MFS multidrug transporter [Podospora didyma]|uniref:MFS multidrug transporter n=1 Tax=Podospora didyma TaxID=330526 RepID=A0AAE0NQP6_9PEZI|nr:putative MFS multidrug transporter [Podospora didyma]